MYPTLQKSSLNALMDFMSSTKEFEGFKDRCAQYGINYGLCLNLVVKYFGV